MSELKQDSIQPDQLWMQRAIELARLGQYSTKPNPNVGCVIVKNGQLVGEGFHPKAGQPHAEVFAMRQAGEQAKGATAYVTLEPCAHYGRTPPCAKGLVEAGIAKVIVACPDPNPLVAGKGVQIWYLRTRSRKTQSGFFKNHGHWHALCAFKSRFQPGWSNCHGIG